jgi:UDP:flavonoid glycosyltransferase YjiC (YdhE family)
VVLIPQATDQFINAKRAANMEAGVSLDPAELNIDFFRSTVRRVRGESARVQFAENAAALNQHRLLETVR